MIRYIIGAVLGAMGTYLYTTSPTFRRKGEPKALGDGFRLPLPATSVELPTDLEDFDLIDELVCECALKVRDSAPDALAEPVAAAAAIQFCVAAELYAADEVPWPPVPGDHPTIHQLWGVLGARVRRLIVRGELQQVCPVLGVPQPKPIPGAPVPRPVPLPGEPVPPPPATPPEGGPLVFEPFPGG